MLRKRVLGKLTRLTVQPGAYVYIQEGDKIWMYMITRNRKGWRVWGPRKKYGRYNPLFNEIFSRLSDAEDRLNVHLYGKPLYRRTK